MRRFRGVNDEVIEFLHPQIRSLTPGTRVLELGCGAGYALRYLAWKHRIEPQGLDLNDYTGRDPMPFCNRDRSLVAMLQEMEVPVRIGTIEENPFPDESFDFIFSYRAFWYVEDKLKGVQEAYRVLRVGGTMVLDMTIQNGTTGIVPGDILVDRPGLEIQPARLTAAYTNRLVIKKNDAGALEFPPLRRTRYVGLQTICYY